MIFVIARHEFAQFVRDGRLRWALALVLCLLLAAVAGGWHQQQRQSAERAYARQVELERWHAQGDKNPHSAAHYGIYAFKPAARLAAIDPGIDPFVGVGIWLEAHNMNELLHRPAQDATALARFGDLNAALVLQILLPLLIVLLTFGAFAADRESGRLRQLLSLAVPPRALVAGKALGLAAALGAVLLPAIALATWLLLRPSTAAAPTDALPLALVALAYISYLAIFVLVALAVSAWAATARLALTILLGFWICSCLVVPRLAGDLAEHVHPAPSRIAFDRRMQQLLAPSHSMVRVYAVRDRLLEQYGVARPEDLPVDWRGIALQQGEEENYPIFDREFEALFDIYRAQERIFQQAAVFSPLLAAQSLSQALAGTDVEHHRNFVRAAEMQRRTMQEILNGDLTTNGRDGVDYRAGAAVWAKIPPFDYQPPPLRDVLQHYAWAIGAFLAWLALSVMAALQAARRLRP